MYRKFEILQGTRRTPVPVKLAKTLLYIGAYGITVFYHGYQQHHASECRIMPWERRVAAFTSTMRIKMFFICTFESLGIAMATYSGQNYGAGKPERIWLGIKASALMMIIYAIYVRSSDGRLNISR